MKPLPSRGLVVTLVGLVHVGAVLAALGWLAGHSQNSLPIDRVLPQPRDNAPANPTDSPVNPGPSEPDWQDQTGLTVAPGFPSQLIANRIRYPELAARMEVQATVVLELFIDETGLIRKVNVVKDHKDPRFGFAQAAVQALEGVVCTPAQIGDRRVAVRFRYPVRFILR